MTVIEIRPHRWGWKMFGHLALNLCFRTRLTQLITPQNRACFCLLDDPKTPQQVGQVFLIGRVICLPLKALLWGERLVFTGLGV